MREIRAIETSGGAEYHTDFRSEGLGELFKRDRAICHVVALEDKIMVTSLRLISIDARADKLDERHAFAEK